MAVHRNKAKKAEASAAEVVTLHPIVHGKPVIGPWALRRIMPSHSETISQSEHALHRLQTQAI